MTTNLTCKVDICEVKGWFGGAAGVCNVTSGLCECPIGFSGVFVLNPSNGCHLSESFKYSIVTLLFVLNVLTNTLLISYIVLVALQLSRLRRKRVLSMLPRPPVVTPNQAFRSMVIRAHKATLRQRVIRRKRLVLLNLFLYQYFTVCDLYRTTQLFLDINVYAEELPVAIAWTYGTSSCALMAALYTTAYLHYRSIPNAAALAARVGIRSVYVLCPKLIYLTIHANVILCAAVMLGFTYAYVLGVAPIVENFTVILSVLVAALHWDGVLVYYSIYSLKAALFKQIIETAHNLALGRLKTARFRIKLFLTFVCSIAIGQTVFAIVAASERRVHFVLFTVLTMLYYLSCMVFGYFLLHDHVRSSHQRTTLKETDSNTSLMRKTSRPEVQQSLAPESPKNLKEGRALVTNNLSAVAEARSPN